MAEAIAWWLEATGGYGVKLVNPGGVEMWKHGNRNVTALDDEVEGLGVTPRARAGGDRRRGGRAGPPSSRPCALQQPRGGGELAHHAGHARHPAGPARAPRPPPVPRVRRDAGQAAPLARARAGRAPRRAPGAQRRHRPGDVRPRDDADRRRARLRAAARDHRRQVAERRPRGGDRLRHSPPGLPRAQLRSRAAVGHRPGAVPAQPRPLAGRALDRPSQRRLVPELPAAHPAADGPRVPQRADRPRQPEGDTADGAQGRPRARVHAGRDRDHHPRRARQAARAGRQGSSRGRRRRRRDGLQRERGPRGDVRHAAVRHQGWTGDRRGR